MYICGEQKRKTMTKQDLINAGFICRPVGAVDEYVKSINKEWNACVIIYKGRAISFYFFTDGETNNYPDTESEFWDILNGVINPDEHEFFSVTNNCE